MLTGGSTSVRAFEARLREAGRGGAGPALHGRGARAGTSIGRSSTPRDGFVWRGDDRLPFAELAEAAARLRPARRPADARRRSRTGWPASRCRGSTLPAKIDGIGAVRRRRPPARHGLCRGAQRPARAAASPASTSAAADARARRARDLRQSRTGSAVAATNWWAARHARSTRCSRASTCRPAAADQRAASRARCRRARRAATATASFEAGDVDGAFAGASPVDAPLRGRPRARARRSSR